MIDGVTVKELVTHSDERGFFREIIRVTDDIFAEGFGQWSHSLMHQGVIKAWHIHRKQVDWWYVVSGVLRLALYDARPESPSYRARMEMILGDHQPARVVRVPPGVAHGCKVLSGPVNLFYITSQVYDTAEEGRIPFDDPTINYDWLSGPPIK